MPHSHTAQQIKVARQAAGLSKRQLARTIWGARGTNRVGDITRWEDGSVTPTFDNLVEIARATDQPLEFFARPAPTTA